MTKKRDVLVHLSREELLAAADRRAVARDSDRCWIDGRRRPSQEMGRLGKLKLTEVDQWARAGGADAHEADEGPKPRGTR